MATRFAPSRMARCLLTACRVIARRVHRSPKVWPLSARSRSSNSRRLASASALNTSSMTTICNLLVACQAEKKPATGMAGVVIVQRSLIEPLPDELLLVERIVADASLQRIGLNGAVDAIAEGRDRRRVVRLHGRLRRGRAVGRI